MASCPSCQYTRRLHRERLGDTEHARARRAEKFCRAERIDLASAYSVLLGHMALDEARWWVKRGGGTRERFDPGFREAVREGRLTREQALARGDRVLYASNLMHDHGLSIHEAFDVTDNRVRLADLRGPSGGKPSPVATETRREPSAATVYSLAVVILIALVSAALIVRGRDGGRHQDPIVRASRETSKKNANGLLDALRQSIEVRTDRVGRPVQIVGPDAELVLETFCRTEPGSLEPVRVLAGPGETYGIFRRNGREYSLALQRRAGDDRWSTGNGIDPIATLAVGRDD